MKSVTPWVDFGFCTDGDWVERDVTGKLYWLPQGADERVVGRYAGSGGDWKILFTGSVRNCGIGRQKFVDDMTATYGNGFRHVASGVHGVSMGRLIADSPVVVAPNFPVTDQYWSNRIYNSLGFGACLLHPKVGGLSEQYSHGTHYLAYSTMGELHDMIGSLLEDPATAERLRTAGYERTTAEHLYRHRCEELIKIVEGK